MVKKSSFSNEQTGYFDGAFAAVSIKAGELALALLWTLEVFSFQRCYLLVHSETTARHILNL